MVANTKLWKRWIVASFYLGSTFGMVDIPLRQTVILVAQAESISSFQQQVQALESQAQSYSQQGQTDLAQQTYVEVATLVRNTAKDIFREIIPIIGEEHPALSYAQRSLELSEKSGDRLQIAQSLNLIGQIQFASGGTSNARATYRQAIAELESLADTNPEKQRVIAYSNIYLGQVEQAVVNTAQAQGFYNDALSTFQALNDPEGEILARQNIADLAQQQRNFLEAVKNYRSALQLARSADNKAAIGEILLSLGDLQKRQREYPQAKQSYQEALEATQNTANFLRQRGQLLNRLGSLELQVGNHTTAVELYTKALGLAQQVGDLTEQGSILRNLSIGQQQRGNYAESFDFLQQAAVLYNQMGLRGLEAEVLAEMGATQNVLGNKELAILFYKQAVQVFEARRAELSEILGDASTPSKVFSPVYRRLGDLLLSGDRPAEAQQAVDLLKVQEVDEYLRGGRVEANATTVEAVTTLPAEEKVLAVYQPLKDQAIALGKELLALRRIPQVELTPAQLQRITEITTLQQDLTREFSAFSRSPEVRAALQDVSATAREQNLGLNTLRHIADNLRSLDERSVILYPLVLEDRLELIVASPFAPPVRRTVDVSREELNSTIESMRQGLTSTRRNTVIEPARQLYDWLIAPIEGDLQATGATTIIYAPDDQLRYVPLVALNDGDRWLVERFRVNNITAASLTDFTSQPPNILNILAGAFTQGEYKFQAGQRDFSFAGLPFAGVEVNNIASTIPNTTTLFDSNFNAADTVPLMDNFNIVHFATHAAFVPGEPKDSFILMGNGDRITLEEVQNSWFLTNVELIVLSACQTAVGGEMGNGEEILGFGYLMQDAGAKAAIASLWSVSDGGTQALMNDFYSRLLSGSSKSEALRQAQIAMIRGELEIDDSIPNTSHPYYWSPFILIGNGL
ncbi:CHAT domain-containing protein [[Limnothrix rosea] IAM M-220]|uniref:CHAT domain-containing protein n=1 Tax=[Limnothrix rosea] IAM M-220 TaxID=454133 RepID=UPI00095B258F|nr:CHAT domain-containing protein [[Limnothrix rosea] IAM M-220]OKH18448.1 hypothetical protein NIES208_05670 [[Limnothrix rosea] IAM M-220]